MCPADDRFRETHHLLCYARAVTNYRRNFICGGSFFFTANLSERRLRLLVDSVELVMPGLVPGIHDFGGPRRRGWPGQARP
jgi:hypothetical protein